MTHAPSICPRGVGYELKMHIHGTRKLACFCCYLLSHGYSFQWTQLPLVPFDRGKSSSFDFSDSRTNLFEEGGNDTSHKSPNS